MKKAILLTITLILGIVLVASAQGEVSLPIFSEKGELFLLEQGETETIQIPSGRIDVQLVEIGHNPAEISDLRVDDITFSNNNPQPGESIHIAAPITNVGTGIARAVELQTNYGTGESSTPAIVVEILPGQTISNEYDYVYNEEGIYTIMVVARTDNDINNANNIVCEQIVVGNPQNGGGSGCGALPQNIIPKKAHVLYKKYRGQNIVEEQDLWLSVDGIGSVVEVMKLSNTKALLSVPR